LSGPGSWVDAASVPGLTGPPDRRLLKLMSYGAEHTTRRAPQSDGAAGYCLDHHQPEKSVCTNWISGMLRVLTIAKSANSTTQSNPMLIPSDGSSFACLHERISLDTPRSLGSRTCRPWRSPGETAHPVAPLIRRGRHLGWRCRGATASTISRLVAVTLGPQYLRLGLMHSPYRGRGHSRDRCSRRCGSTGQSPDSRISHRTRSRAPPRRASRDSKSPVAAGPRTAERSHEESVRRCGRGVIGRLPAGGRCDSTASFGRSRFRE
jgi:hypothetical protein